MPIGGVVVKLVTLESPKQAALHTAGDYKPRGFVMGELVGPTGFEPVTTPL